MHDTRTIDASASSSSSSSRTDLLSVVAAGLLWGTGGLAGALLTARSALDPLAVAGYRLAIGGGLVLAWLQLSGRAGALRFSRHGCRRLLVVALLAGVVPELLLRGGVVDVGQPGDSRHAGLGAGPGGGCRECHRPAVAHPPDDVRCRGRRCGAGPARRSAR